MIHEAKCHPECFEKLKSGVKPFEVHKKDRPYQIGDLLAVNEFADFQYEFCSDDERERFNRMSEGGRYSGDCLLFKITYILDDKEYCKDGMVILGLARCEI